jgi:hypothetical protein
MTHTDQWSSDKHGYMTLSLPAATFMAKPAVTRTASNAAAMMLA